MIYAPLRVRLLQRRYLQIRQIYETQVETHKTVPWRTKRLLKGQSIVLGTWLCKNVPEAKNKALATTQIGLLPNFSDNGIQNKFYTKHTY